ncbi:hypothetical protein [Mycobacterium kyogaense]|uniref:hypothetical protein n=1 Tax=Mycobacterium kyogaense TaxID=2212479 RepID=UPI000DACBFCB|nr:hypothetical protein [Mycobacterium kyogaense]
MPDYEDGGVQDIRSTREYLAHFDHKERTPEDREAAFAAYVETSAEDERDTGWHNDLLESRRQLFMRRYQRPAPPVGLHTDPHIIRGEHRKWEPAYRGDQAA